MKRRLTDQQIANAMEMHVGLGMTWKKVAKEMEIDYKVLKNAIDGARSFGMIKFSQRSNGNISLKKAAYLQRRRIERDCR